MLREKGKPSLKLFFSAMFLSLVLGSEASLPTLNATNLVGSAPAYIGLDAKKEILLPVAGRVVYDKERIADCAVKVYRGNELIEDFLTDKSGRYQVELELGHEYMFHFQKEGYLNKMFAVDALNGLPKEANGYPEFTVNVIMLPMEKFKGVDMDHLEFPFALVKYSKRLQMFDNDPKYTTNMKRAIAAAMLQSGRANR